jgi:hypothetical protein
MIWIVELHEDFVADFDALPEIVQEEIVALTVLLESFGPELQRPHCDTLKGSYFTNMKELRFSVNDGEWRLAFAFDPRRNAILLVAGDKSGISSRLFYSRLIKKADKRFSAHLEKLSRRRK